MPAPRRPPPACWPTSPGCATGKGQKVVIDTQACVVWTLLNEQGYPVLHGDFLRRTGPVVGSATSRGGRCGRARTAR